MTLTAGLVLALGMMAGPAAAQGPPEHGHVLLLHAEWTGAGPELELESFARCVELANGRPVPNDAHHANIHTGTAGEQTRSNAGHLVVPLAPLTGLNGCGDFTS